MRTGITAAALALALGGGVAMAGGVEVHQRVGAFAKGGPGIVVSPREEAPAAERLADAAAPATQAAEKYVCPMGDATSDKPGKCPKCGMEMKKVAKAD